MPIECERWEWRELFASERGPKDQGTRLVLFVLSLHMNQDGGSCFPSQKTIAERSGLSERSVRTHLANAARSGWLKIGQQSQKGKAWFVHNYVATIPEELVSQIPTKPWEDDPQYNERAEKSAGRRPKRKRQRAAKSAGRETAETLVEDGQRAANGAQRPEILTERAAIDDTTPGKICSDARQGLPTNSSSNTPYNSSINTPIERAALPRSTDVGESLNAVPKEPKAMRGREPERIHKVIKHYVAEGYSDQQIASVAKVSIEEVQRVRAEAA